MGRPSSLMEPSDRPAHAGERLQELALPVAGDARDADDLAGMNREGGVGDAQHAAVVDDGQVVTSSTGAPGTRSAFSTRRSTRRPTIISASCGGEVSAVTTVADHLAAAHHRDPVRDRHDLAQLVGDQDDGLALRLERRRSSNSASASAA